MELKTSDSEIDLESGETTSEDDRIGGKNILGRALSGVFNLDNSTTPYTRGSEFYKKIYGSCNDLVLVESDLLNFVDKKLAKEKRKKTSFKKLSKPPRPPKGPSLDPADIKMVKEFSKLAALKRKRVERLKNLRKIKTEKKGSSFQCNLFAAFITILFCFVIISQGLLGSRT